MGLEWLGPWTFMAWVLKWIVPHSKNFPLATYSCYCLWLPGKECLSISKAMPFSSWKVLEFIIPAVVTSCTCTFLLVIFPAQRILANRNDFLCCGMSMFILFHQEYCLLLAKGSIHLVYIFCNDIFYSLPYEQLSAWSKICFLPNFLFCSTSHLFTNLIRYG